MVEKSPQNKDVELTSERWKELKKVPTQKLGGRGGILFQDDDMMMII